MTGAGTKEVWNRVPEFSLSQHYSFKCLLRFTALCPRRGHFPGGGGGKQATDGRWQDWRNACVRWSLAHGGHRTNISSSSSDCMVQVQSITCSPRPFSLGSGHFIYKWFSYQPVGLACESEWLSSRPEAMSHMLLPSPRCPTREITATLARSPPEDIIRKRGKTAESPWGLPAPSGFPAELPPLLRHRGPPGRWLVTCFCKLE